MAYSELEQLSEGEFKRLCGVSRSTFAEMVGVLHPHMNRQGRRGGQALAERGRPIASGIGILARISESVSHLL